MSRSVGDSVWKLSAATLAGARIVVAEDDPVMREYVRRLLVAQGGEVLAVADGEAALEAIRTTRPEVALLDVVMPRLDGFELLKLLRADRELRTLPVIMLSAHTDDESKLEGFAAGADDFLVKPFSDRELLARVAAHLQLVRLRKQAEQLLAENEERLRMALSAARMVAWEWHVESKRVSTTANAAELAGLLPGVRLKDLEQALAFIHPEDIERQSELLSKVVSDQCSHVTEFRLVRPSDSEIVWMEAHAKAVNDGAKGLRVLGVTRDITERKRAEVTRKELTEQLETELIEMRRLQATSARLIPEGEIDAFLDEILSAAIAVMRAHAGTLQLVDAQGKLRVLAWRDVDDALLAALSGAGAETHTTYGDALRARRRIIVEDLHSGSIGAAPGDVAAQADIRAVQATPLISRSGRPVGVLSTYWREPHQPAERDLSLLDLLARQAADLIERHEAHASLRENEQKLRELSRSLEERVLERTIELERQTIQLRALAAELAATEQRERKRLAALLHDDLQQLLVAVGLKLRHAARLIDDEPALDVMEKAAELLSRAVDSARDLSYQLRPPVLYEAGLVPALHWLASVMWERHRLRVAVDAEESGRSTLNDDSKALVFECCRELLFNVTKYAHVEHATVQVREGRQWLGLSVEDTGRGFDPNVLKKVRKSGGVGLFSIRERLAALGGSMTIRAQPGSGTRVELRVPIASADLSSERPPALLAETSGPAADGYGVGTDARTRVVVVDDHALVREGIIHILSRQDHISVVGEAGDGVAAIESVELHHPDVVLLDINMPHMNGIDAAREINRRWPKVAIIALSVQSDDVTAQAMRESGAYAFISKSGDSDRLLALITAAHLAKRHELSAPRAGAADQRTEENTHVGEQYQYAPGQSGDQPPAWCVGYGKDDPQRNGDDDGG